MSSFFWCFMKRSVNVKKLKKIFTGFIVFILFLGCAVIPSFTSHAAEDLSVGMRTYTIEIPISSSLRVESGSTVWYPTSIGQFTLTSSSQFQFAMIYQVALSDILPGRMTGSNIVPYSIEWGMDLLVTDQIGFDMGGPGESPIKPVFNFSARSGSTPLYNKTFWRVGAWDSTIKKTNLYPYDFSYSQGGSDRNFDDLYNSPYVFRYKFNSLTDNISSYDLNQTLTLYVGNFLGDTDASNKVVFNCERFYITFTYLDKSVSDDLDSAIGGVGDFDQSSSDVGSLEDEVNVNILDLIRDFSNRLTENPMDFSGFQEILQSANLFVFNLVFDDLILFPPLFGFISLGLCFLVITFIFKFI